MAKRKLKKNFKGTSSVAGGEASQKEMTQPEKYYMFSLAAIALLLAVSVAPLTAEMSNFTCKYTSLLTKSKLLPVPHS